MPVYSIQAPDGNVYDIEGPEGASEQQLFRVVQGAMREREYAALQRRADEIRNRPAPPPEPTFGGQVKETFKGVVPGAIGLLESAGTGISALLPEETEKAAREQIKKIAGVAKEPFAAAPGYEQSFGRQIGEGLGSLLPMAPLALLGPAGVAAGVGIGTAAGAGEARTRAEQAGATEEQRATATGLGIAPGAMDAAVDMALAAFPGGAGKAISVIKRALLSGGVEGATEAAQEVAQNAIAKGVYKPEQELIEGAGESATVGGAVGVLASLLFDAVVPGRRGGTATPPPAGEEKPAKTTEPETPLLGYTPEPFTPTAAPDGSVFTTRAEYDQYMADKERTTRERAEDVRTSDPLAALDPQQRELARGAKQSQLEETFAEGLETPKGIVPPTVPQISAELRDAEQNFDVAKALHEDLEHPEVVAARERLAKVQQKQFDTLYEGQSTPTPEPTADTAEATSAELRELVAKPSTPPVAPTRQQIFAEVKTAEANFDTAKALHKDSKHPEVVAANVALKEARKKEAEFLSGAQPPAQQLPAIAESKVKVIPKVSIPEATVQGTAPTGVEELPTNLSDAVKSTVEQVARASKPKVKAEPVTTGAAPIAAPEAAPIAAPEPNILTAEALQGTGLKSGGAYNALVGKDLANPEQLAQVQKTVREMRGNQYIPKATTDAVLALLPKLETPSVTTTTPTTAPAAGGQPALAGADSGTTGVSPASGKPDVSGKPKPAPTVDTEPTKAPEPRGLGGTGQPVSDTGARKVDESGALETPESAAAAAYAEKQPRNQQAWGRVRGSIGRGELPASFSEAAKEHYNGLSDTDKIKYKNELDRISATPPALPDDVDFLDKQDATGLSTPLHPMVVQMLKANNLVGALKFIGDQKLGRSSTIARKLAGLLDGINVLITDIKEDSDVPLIQALLAKDPSAAGVAGAYLASRKEGKSVVILDTTKGMDVWTLLHESTHALVNRTLDNKNHPLTKQLQKLFDEVEGSLGTAYGTTDLKEFAAEAWSNPKFQKMLAEIMPKAEPVSAWHRFTRAVRNFMRGLIGLDVKPPMSALDATDKVLDAIITGRDNASPMLDSVSFLRKEGESVADASKRILTEIGRRSEKLPLLNRERVGAIQEILGGKIGGGVKNIVLQSLPLNALTDVAKDRIPMAPKLDELSGERTSAENKRNQAVEQSIKQANEWEKKNPELVETFNDVVYDSTTNEVDPSDSLKYYEQFWLAHTVNGVTKYQGFDTREARNAAVKDLNDKATAAHQAAGGVGKVKVAKESGDKNPEKIAKWEALQPKWKALGPEGQAIYKHMRDSYKAMYDDLRRVLDERIDATVENKDTRVKLKNELYEKLFAGGTIRPYFPLTRKGDYWLSYNVGAIRHIEAFNSSYERDAAKEELAQNKEVSELEDFFNPSKSDYKKTAPPSFVRDVLRTLSANDVNPVVTEQVMRLFLDTLPETSFAQSLRSRKGTPGFDRDAFEAFRTKPYSLSHQLTNMEFSAKFEKLRGEMKDHMRTMKDRADAQDLYEELNERIDFAISPQIPQWSKVARSLVYGWTLGLNVSSALVGLIQVPGVVAPYLGGAFGMKDTTRAIGRAMKYFTNSGMKRQVKTLVGDKMVTVPAGPSIDNYDFTSKDAPKHLETLIKVAESRGQLARSQAYDILGIDDNSSVLGFINRASGFMQHHTERMARQVTLAAAYELKLQQLVGKGKKLSDSTEAQRVEAAKYAVGVSELTIGGTSAASAPRIAQNAIGSIVFMYKRFGVQMYYMLFKTTKEAFFDTKPKGMSDADFKMAKSAARRQIAGIYAATALLAGAQGLPLFGIAAMLYNLFLQGEDEDDFDTAARKFLGEGMYSGAVNALTGQDVAARISLSDLIFRDSMTRPSENPMLSFIEYVGGPAIGVTSRVIRGVQNINEGEIQRGVEQIMPSAIGNAMKSIRYAEEGVTTARGDPIVEDINAWTIGAQFFGFAPAEYTRQLEINSKLKAFDRDVSERRTKMLREYYVATRVGDSDGAAEVMDKIMKFNERYPENAITPKTIKNSMAQHMRTTQEMYSGITVSKPMRDRIMRMAEEYEDYEE